MDNDFNIKKEYEDLNTIIHPTHSFVHPMHGQTIFEYTRRQSLRKIPLSRNLQQALKIKNPVAKSRMP